MDNPVPSSVCKSDFSSLDYISVNCSRTPHCCVWGRNGLLAYGANQAVALARIEVSIHFAMNERTGCVQGNC